VARIVTKHHALNIASKLKAKLIVGKKQRPHDLYAVYENDVLVTNFSIRRGSNKEAGHDHIPGQLFLGPKAARDLAQCPMSREEWIKEVRRMGKI
jgi:hypothetical protein